MSISFTVSSFINLANKYFVFAVWCRMMETQKSHRAYREKEVVKRLCKVLQDHGQIIHVKADVRPASSSIFRDKWDKLTRGIGLKLQPQIDILLEAETYQKSRQTILCGIEVKYFEKAGSRFNWSFYAGIDEAIATLNYGLDHSALWQIFSPSTEKGNLVQYGAPFWKHIEKLKLPIEFSLLVDRGSDFDVHAKTGEYSFKLSENLIAFNKPNPIKDEALQIQLREMLYEWCKFDS